MTFVHLQMAGFIKWFNDRRYQKWIFTGKNTAVSSLNYS